MSTVAVSWKGSSVIFIQGSANAVPGNLAWCHCSLKIRRDNLRNASRNSSNGAAQKSLIWEETNGHSLQPGHTTSYFHARLEYATFHRGQYTSRRAGYLKFRLDAQQRRRTGSFRPAWKDDWKPASVLSSCQPCHLRRSTGRLVFPWPSQRFSNKTFRPSTLLVTSSPATTTLDCHQK